MYIYSHIPSLLHLPPTLPIPPLQVVTKHWADLPVLCGCFPLAIYFTFGNVYMSMLLSHFVPAYPAPSPCPQIHSLRLRLYSCPACRFIRTIYFFPPRLLDCYIMKWDNNPLKVRIVLSFTYLRRRILQSEAYDLKKNYNLDLTWTVEGRNSFGKCYWLLLCIIPCVTLEIFEMYKVSQLCLLLWFQCGSS